MGYLKFLHGPFHPQIQHPIPLLNWIMLHLVQPPSLNVSKNQHEYHMANFGHKNQLVQIFNLNPTFKKCYEDCS
jgi:hypothetical protein